MNFLSVFEKMVQLFLIMMVGFVAGKARFLDRDMRSKLTAFVLHITLPAVILSSVMNADALPGPAEFLQLLCFVLLCFAILIGTSFLMAKLLHIPKESFGSSMFALIFSNTAYMGFPVVTAIWGSGAVFFASMFTIPYNLLADTFGVSLVQHDRKVREAFSAKGPASAATEEESRPFAEADADPTAPVKRTWKDALFTPIFFATLMTVFLALTRIPVPETIRTTVTSIGQVTTPAAMMIIGASLAEMPVREIFTTPRAYLLSAVRLLVMPLVIWAIFRLLVKNELFLGVSVIVSAMPVAAVGQMYCLRYGGDEKLMAQTTFLSTVCSIVTIPLMAMLVR